MVLGLAKLGGGLGGVGPCEEVDDRRITGRTVVERAFVDLVVEDIAAGAGIVPAGAVGKIVIVRPCAERDDEVRVGGDVPVG